MLPVLLAIAGAVAAVIGFINIVIGLRAKQKDPASGLPDALRGARFWVLVVIVALAASIVGAANWIQSQPRYRIVAQLYVVTADEKGALLSSARFEGSGSEVAADTIREIQSWVDQKLRTDQSVSDNPVHGRLVVPADVTTGITVEMNPPGPFELLGVFDTPGGKSRTAMTQSMFALKQPFTLEIHRPGYQVWSIAVPAGQQIDSQFDLKPTPVRLGIEAFAGRDTLAAQLAVGFDAFRILDPKTLEALKAKIREEKIKLEQNPIQESYRTSLGVDYILGGSFEAIVSK